MAIAAPAVGILGEVMNLSEVVLALADAPILGAEERPSAAPAAQARADKGDIVWIPAHGLPGAGPWALPAVA
eukprot:14006242-Alexandrium_andersonii.AAC.1